MEFKEKVYKVIKDNSLDEFTYDDLVRQGVLGCNEQGESLSEALIELEEDGLIVGALKRQDIYYRLKNE